MARKATRSAEQPDDQADKQRTMLMLDRGIHRRLKAYCVLTGQTIEDVGARWIADRLPAEEKKLRKRQ